LIVLQQDHAVIPLGRQFLTVVTEPCGRETVFNGQSMPLAHFTARGRSGELVECSAYRDRARTVIHDLNIGDTVIADIQVKILPVLDVLEYKYTGSFICIDPRQ